MEVVSRPHLAAGVAVIAAGAIAISPLAPPAPDIHLPELTSASVSLSAATNPIGAYFDLVSNTIAGVQHQINAELADPFPILQQIAANQIGTAESLTTAFGEAGVSLVNALNPANPTGLTANLQKAAEQFLAGNIDEAVATAWGATLITALGLLPVLPAVTGAIQKPVGNLNNILKDPTAIVGPVLGVLVVAYDTLTTAGNIGQGLVDATRAGDVAGLVNSLAEAPARLANSFLNGSDGTAGIFGSSGLLSTLRLARDQIAADITPGANEEAASLAGTTSARTTTVTLDVTPKALRAKQTRAVESTTVADKSTDAAAVAKDAPAAASTPSTAKRVHANPLKKLRQDIRASLKNGLKKPAARHSSSVRGKDQSSTDSGSSTKRSGSHTAGKHHNSGKSRHR